MEESRSIIPLSILHPLLVSPLSAPSPFGLRLKYGKSQQSQRGMPSTHSGSFTYQRPPCCSPQQISKDERAGSKPHILCLCNPSWPLHGHFLQHTQKNHTIKFCQLSFLSTNPISDIIRIKNRRICHKSPALEIPLYLRAQAVSPIRLFSNRKSRVRANIFL